MFDKRANKRITRLINKLGLTEYEGIDEISYYSLIEKGILQDIEKTSRQKDNHSNTKIDALLKYLNLEVKTEKDIVSQSVWEGYGLSYQDAVELKYVVKPVSKKRKYVKSGKYSKKGKK